MDDKKILLIDGLSILSRAYFAMPVLTNDKGQATNGILGFLNMYFKFMDEEQPTHVAVAFDMPKPTHRHERYSEYKGTRKAMPVELTSQIPILMKLLTQMGITTIGIEGLEADDVLGSLALRAEREGFMPTILSGDRDLLQIATNTVKVSIPKTSKGQTTTHSYYAKDVEEQLGVTPRAYIDVKALMGDTSDNIPGVPSIGEKTATKIIQTFGSVEAAIQQAKADPTAIKPKKAAENLVIYEEQARMSKELATIVINAEIDFDINDMGVTDPFNEASMALMRDLGLRSILKRAKPQATPIQEAKPVDTQAITELSTLEGLKGRPVAYRISAEGLVLYAENAYIIRHDRAGLIKAFFEDENIAKVAFDAKKDMHMLHNKGVAFKGLAFDVLLGGYLLGALKEGSGIEEAAAYFLNENLSSQSGQLSLLDNVDDKEALTKEAHALSRIHAIIAQKLEEQGMTSLYYDIEQPLLHVLFNMESHGIGCDKNFITEFGKGLDADIAKLAKEVYALAGEEFNISSPKQVGEILFDKMGLKGGKKTKTGGYSTAAEVLEKLAVDNEIVDKILQYRFAAKLKSTYVDGLLKTIVDGRIHTRFSQTTAATGRLSSIEPNLQNIPIRTAVGRELRRAFIPADGFVFVDADYSQIELRVLAELSQDEGFITAFKSDKDIHKQTAAAVFNLPLEDVTDKERSYAKAVNFGIVYGISAFSLSDDIKVSVKEADRFIQEYFGKYPKVKAYMDSAITSARERGFAQTMFNRRRSIPEIKAANFTTRSYGERIAMNMPVQGTAADIIKLAMIRVHNRLADSGLASRLILQVHDELLIETKEDELLQVIEIVNEEMNSAATLSVPLKVDIAHGGSWYDTK